MREPALAFTVPGEPIPQLRPRVVRQKHTGHVMAFTPDKCVAHAERIRIAALGAIREAKFEKLLSGPLRVDVCFYRTRPKSAKRNSLPTQKPDIDNLYKIFDAITGVVWESDAQVVALWLVKRYAADGEQPRTEVAIYEVTEQTAAARPSADQLSIFGFDHQIVA